MNEQAALIIGDWGNSNARLWLCRSDGVVVATRRGPGIASLRSNTAAIGAAFANMTAGWPTMIPALLAGVVGASFGWRDAGYLPCPITLKDIGGHLVRAPTNERAVWITPGISCVNAWGEPDTMRGEELQITGWATASGVDDALVVLPGTHCKWAQIAGGMVTQFHSSISGELFALLCDHSVMIDRAACDAPHDPSAFAEGVALARTASDVDLGALLFAARARQATGAMTAARAPSFLSGIVIGCDVRNALRHHDPSGSVIVIGEDGIGQRYIDALGHWTLSAQRVASDDAMRAGLLAVARRAGLESRATAPYRNGA